MVLLKPHEIIAPSNITPYQQKYQKNNIPMWIVCGKSQYVKA